MTTYQVPAGTAGAILGLIVQHDFARRSPAIDGDTMTFTPDLTAAELAIVDDFAQMVRFGVVMSLDEWRAIKADAAALKAYLGVASPTAAQTAAATKAVIRVLATIIRS